MSDVLIRTERLVLRKTQLSDAEPLLELFNQADFIAHIRDKKIRTLDEAQQEIRAVFFKHYQDYGYGLLSMDFGHQPCVGLCGLVKRPALDIPDIGFAVRSRYQNQGLVSEASRAILSYAFNELKLEKLAAIVKPDNMASIRIITKLGMPFIAGKVLEAGEPQVKYFELDRQSYFKNTGEPHD